MHIEVSLTLHVIPDATHPLLELAPETLHPVRPLHTHPNPTFHDRLDTIDDTERTASNRPKEREGCHAPQDELQVEVVSHRGGAIRLTNGHGKDGVRNHPGQDHVRADILVVIFLLLTLGYLRGGDFNAVAEVAERFIIARIDIELLGRHLELDGGIFAVTPGSSQVRVDHVVTFSTPGYIVRIAECVDLKGADVGREKEEVLAGGGDHVPGIEVEDGHEEVESNCGGHGDDEVGEDVVSERNFRVGCQLTNHDIDTGKGVVCHDYAI